MSLFFIGINIVPVREYNGSKYDYDVKIQTEVVYYDSNQGGVCPFGIWISAKNFYNTHLIENPTRVCVRIFLETEIEKVYNTSEIPPEKYWCPSPPDFIKWQGDYFYNIDPSKIWKWSLQGITKDFSYGATYTPSSEDYWLHNNQVINNYRYLGDFISRNSKGNHKFNTLLALHVVNSEARLWDQGIYSGDDQGSFYERILNIRIKLEFEYQHHFINWETNKILKYISEVNIPLIGVKA